MNLEKQKDKHWVNFKDVNKNASNSKIKETIQMQQDIMTTWNMLLSQA